MTNSTIQDFQSSDIIDVRDIIARVEELREERDSLLQDVKDANESDDSELTLEQANNNVEDWVSSNKEELETLESVLQNLCGYGADEQWEGEWYPVTLIKDTYFEESMDEMVKDCYYIPKNLPPFIIITLDYAALKQDYREVEFCGDTYYYY